MSDTLCWSNSDIDLYQGDCFDWLPTIADESIDCVISDPPFCVSECHWDRQKIDVERLQRELTRIVKPQGSILLFTQQPFTTDLINANRSNFKYLWYWNKNRSGLHSHAKNRPMTRVEEVAVFSKGAVAHQGRSTRRMHYYPQGATPGTMRTITKDDSPNHRPRPKQIGRTYQQWTGFPHNVLTYAKPPKSFHPTAKPVDLLRFLIRSYTLPGETVLDCFAGSGSTLHAARAEGRKAIGMERDAEYFSRVVEEVKLCA